MKLGSLFSGYGGLDLGVQAALGPMKTAWVSDIEPGPSTILTRRFPDSPNLGDITQIDWTRVEPVDVIAGGSPCQDLSLAGARAGMKPGTRSGLWESMFTAIATIRPRLVVWENVRGALSANAFSLMESREGRVGGGADGPSLRALGRVLGDLASIGYDAQWVGLRASDVGAPHQRYRVFVTAHPAGDTWWLQHRDGEGPTDAGSPGWGRPGYPAAPEAQGRGSSAIDRGRDRAPVALLLPSPCAQQSGNSPENHLRKKPGRQVVTDLAVLVENGLLATGGKLLPTPMANEAEKAAFAPRFDGRQEYLTNTIARLLPTPRASDGDKGGPNQRGSRGDLTVSSAVHLMPTPSVADVEGGRKSRSGERGDELLLNGLASANRFGDYAPAIAQWEQILGRPAPHPTQSSPSGKPQLSPRFVEWMMGLPDGWVTDISISRTAQLRALGNGVVPQQAATAIRSMIEQQKTLEVE